MAVLSALAGLDRDRTAAGPAPRGKEGRNGSAAQIHLSAIRHSGLPGTPSRGVRTDGKRGRVDAGEPGAVVAHHGVLPAELGFAGAIPADDANRLRIPRSGFGPGFGPPAMLSWWGITRDTVHLTEALRAADSISRTKPSWRFAAYLRASALANMALARADTGEALKRFLGLPDALSRNMCLADALVRVRLLEARGLREAAEQLSAEPPERDELQEGLLSEVFWILERARVSDRLGNRGREIPAYRFVADVWSHADPELQPYVAEARAALKRLNAEPRP